MLTQYKKSLEAVQEFLATHPHEDFKQLGIKTKSDGNHLILDYDMIEVKWDQPYGYVCRGLILDANTFEPFCVPMLKFWNAAEGHAASINWKTAKVLEKADGSMVARWFSPHLNKFVCTTRRQLPGDIEQNVLQDMGITWDKLISMCLGNLPEEIKQIQDETIVFEVMSPANRVVVNHNKYHAAILARRNNLTLQEEDISHYTFSPKTFAFSSTEECTEFANTLSGLESEGFVVVDNDFNRIKIKGRDYLALHHLKDSAGSSLKSLVLVVRRGEWDEVATAFPEFIPAMNAIGEIVKVWTDIHVKAYAELKGIENQKDFALTLQAKGLPYPVLLFSVRSGKANSIEEAIHNMEDNKFVKAIKPIAEKAGVTIISIEEEE